MKSNFLYSFSFLAIIGLSTVFYSGCTSVPADVTQELFYELRTSDSQNKRIKTEDYTFGKFRFVISKDVVLTKVEKEVGTNLWKTVVTQKTVTNIIHLNASTTGRVQRKPAKPTAEKLEIAFERKGGKPTFTFIQKPEKGTDLYYFETDNEDLIFYNNEYYTITYDKKDEADEPYLMYLKKSKATSIERTIRGMW
jgi:hypothetical protein